MIAFASDGSEHIDAASIAVFDDHMPDGRDFFCGKIAVVIWPGGGGQLHRSDEQSIQALAGRGLGPALLNPFSNTLDHALASGRNHTLPGVGGRVLQISS